MKMMMRTATITLIMAILHIGNSALVHLDDENFKSIVDGSTNVLVNFYAPWCSYCKAFAPHYALLAETYLPEDDLLIAEIEGPDSPAISREFIVSSYPTVLFFPKGSNHPYPYEGDKTLEALTEWINEKLGLERQTPLPPSNVADLNKKNFKSFLNDKEKDAIILFYSRGICPSGNCMGMIYKLDLLTNIYKGDNIKFGRLDGTEAPKFVVEYGAINYPVLTYFPADGNHNDEKFQPEKLEKNPSLEKIVEWINEQAGLYRTVNGTLLPTAGHVKELNELISLVDQIDSQFLTQLQDKMKSLELDETADYEKSYGELYLSYGRKISERGWSYVQHERERLEKMINSSTSKITTKKKTELMFRMNILQAYHQYFRHTYATLE